MTNKFIDQYNLFEKSAKDLQKSKLSKSHLSQSAVVYFVQYAQFAICSLSFGWSLVKELQIKNITLNSSSWYKLRNLKTYRGRNFFFVGPLFLFYLWGHWVKWCWMWIGLGCSFAGFNLKERLFMWWSRKVICLGVVWLGLLIDMLWQWLSKWVGLGIPNMGHCSVFGSRRTEAQWSLGAHGAHHIKTRHNS